MSVKQCGLVLAYSFFNVNPQAQRRSISLKESTAAHNCADLLLFLLEEFAPFIMTYTYDDLGIASPWAACNPMIGPPAGLPGT